MKYADDIRELVGHTPLLKINHVKHKPGVNIFAKLEYLNPAGSIKDRSALEIIKEAEQLGRLKPGMKLVEATSGNMGIGLAFGAINKAYEMIIFIPKDFSLEKQKIMKAYGATVIQTPTEQGMQGAVAAADEYIKNTPGCFIAHQFENPANVTAHLVTGKEIYDDMDGKVDIFVAAAGSGGSITGAAKYLKQKIKNIKIVLADPVGSVIGGGPEGNFKVEGIGNHFVPEIFDRTLVDEVEKIPDAEAYDLVNRMVKLEGAIGGPSSGEALAGAIRQAEKARPGTNIVTIFPDRADRYFSEGIYNF